MTANYQLKKRNIKINKSKSAVLFNRDTVTGEKIKLNSKDKCYCIFSAPGPDMIIHEQNPNTDLTIFVRRAEIKNVSKIQNLYRSIFMDKEDHELKKLELHHQEKDYRMSSSIHPIDVIHIY